MKNSRLTEEILCSLELSAVRNACLDGGLAALRIRRRRRVLAQRAGVLAAVCVIGSWCHSLLRPAPQPDPLLTQTARTPSSAAVETIGDEELLQLFHGKTVALIGPPGNQRFVVFE